MDWTMMQLVPAFLRSGHGRDKDQPREPPHPERDDDKQGWDDEREDRRKIANVCDARMMHKVGRIENQGEVLLLEQ